MIGSFEPARSGQAGQLGGVLDGEILDQGKGQRQRPVLEFGFDFAPDAIVARDRQEFVALPGDGAGQRERAAIARRGDVVGGDQLPLRHQPAVMADDVLVVAGDREGVGREAARMGLHRQQDRAHEIHVAFHVASSGHGTADDV